MYEDCEDWVYLYEHWSLKTVNEAIVEGAGSCLDRHTEGQRNLTFENSVKEAIIDWSAPLMHEADGFITEGLNKVFKGKPWHFKPEDKTARRQVKRPVDFFQSSTIMKLKKLSLK